MATSLESSSPSTLLKGSTSMMCSPSFSPSSDKRFWSNLRTRIDTVLENRKPAQIVAGNVDRTNGLKDDSLLLMRGFDSVAYTLSQLSRNIDNALLGARDLTGKPTLTEIVQETVENKQNQEEDETESGELKRGMKRKLDSPECSDDDQKQNKQKQIPAELDKINKAKNIAISMAKRAASLAREMKSIKSDLCFMQERCNLLEEENRKLRDGVVKGIRPEEDDLVRLQMEALLAEKSRLANENATLKRENLSLNQLVEFHQITSQDPSELYEDVVRGMYLDFSSPLPEEDEEEENCKTPKTPISPPIFDNSASRHDDQETFRLS